jgi:hypothetical protein
MREATHALIYGPAQALSPKTWMPVQERQYCSRGSKTLAYRLWGASNMSLLVPLNYFLLCSLFRRPKPLRARCHMPPILKDMLTPVLKS